MVYEVCDLRDGLFADRLKAEAKNPIEALKKIGYHDIKRTTDNSANIVVYGDRASYLYHGKRNDTTIEYRKKQEREEQLRKQKEVEVAYAEYCKMKYREGE